jgi:hypothetical protein
MGARGRATVAAMDWKSAVQKLVIV